MLYYSSILNKIYRAVVDIGITMNVTSPMDTISTFLDIVVSILSGVVMIIGLGYLKPLKEKTVSATFSFWMQLKVRLINIQKWLKDDVDILNNLYDPSIRASWEGVLSADDERIKLFKNIVEETLQYIERTDNQMPAYQGWHKDYNSLIQYLNDMVLYDICDVDNYFKFTDSINASERCEYVNTICNIIDRMCKGIDIKQEKIEAKLSKDKMPQI